MPIFSGEYPQKTTPQDDDEVLIADNSASRAIKSTRVSAIVEKAVNEAEALVEERVSSIVRFRARKVTAGNVTTSLAKVTMETEDYDIGGNYASGAFTCPKNGYYHFDASIGINNTSHCLISLYKNGSEIARGNRIHGITAGNVVTGISTDLYLQQGDIIETYAIASGTLPIVVADPTTYFSGHLFAED